MKGHPESSGSNKGYAPPETKVIVKLSKNVNYNMVIKKRHLGYKIAAKLGVHYVETGDMNFDSHNVVKGSKEFALKLLNKHVIDSLSMGYPSYVYLKGKMLLIQKYGYLETELFFTYQINKATAIIDRLAETGYL